MADEVARQCALAGLPSADDNLARRVDAQVLMDTP